MTSRLEGRPFAERLCSVNAARAGQDPIGSVLSTEALLLVEMPTPWAASIFAPDAGGSYSQRVRAVQMEALRHRREASSGEASYRGLLGIAPDAAWMIEGMQRVLLISRPGGAFSRYEMAEYQFPADSAEFLAMVRDHYERPERLEAFDRYRAATTPARELLVCTHGQVDVCCARFGVPLYQQLRAEAMDPTRAWRTTHFGGHRFAPTMKDFPSGYTWAFVEGETARAILDRSGEPAMLARHLRGWSGGSPPVQVVDREGFIRHGWAWLDSRREGSVIEADDERGWWRVRFEFTLASGASGSYEATVVRIREIEDAGCGAEWGQRGYKSPEYGLAEFIAW